MTTLPVDVAASCHQLAEQLHAVLHEQMVQNADPGPEVNLLWQAAKLINTAVGGLDYTAEQHVEQWWDVAAISAMIARNALQVAARGATLTEAARYVEDVDITTMGAGCEAVAGRATVELFPPDYDDTNVSLTVSINRDPDRAVTAKADRGPAPTVRPHTPATLLHTAFTVHQAGVALGAVIVTGD